MTGIISGVRAGTEVHMAVHFITASAATIAVAADYSKPYFCPFSRFGPFVPRGVQSCDVTRLRHAPQLRPYLPVNQALSTPHFPLPTNSYHSQLPTKNLGTKTTRTTRFRLFQVSHRSHAHPPTLDARVCLRTVRYYWSSNSL